MMRSLRAMDETRALALLVLMCAGCGCVLGRTITPESTITPDNEVAVLVGSTVTDVPPPNALASASMCICPKRYRQILNMDTCACECDVGFQASRAARARNCTFALFGQPGADRACTCTKCPSGTSSGGGLLNETACSPAPQDTTDGESVKAANTGNTISYNNQCGGRGSTVVNGFPGCGSPGRQCHDAPWTGVQCQSGTVCVRSNEWWWFCNWGSTPTRPVIPAWAQCGGRSTTTVNGLPGCGGAGRECVDAPWSGVQCVAGHTCQRDNEWWWGCKPGTVDPCAGRTCSGRGTCSGGVCTCQAGWTGANCETANPVNPCAGRTCSGRGTCANGVCTCQAGWTGANCETQVTSGGCPAGWERAVGTLYDSWPKAGTVECVQYSGCRWAGLFSRISAGPLFSAQPVCNPNQCLTRTFGGVQYRAQCLAGDQRSFEVACRWPEAAVRAWRMAATWDQDPELLGRTLDVMVEGVPGRVTRVNVQDVCSDSDCAGCCSRNTGNRAYKLIDLEKWVALDLLGNFDPNSATFDINNVPKPLATGRRPGAPEGSVMPLCFRRV